MVHRVCEWLYQILRRVCYRYGRILMLTWPCNACWWLGDSIVKTWLIRRLVPRLCFENWIGLGLGLDLGQKMDCWSNVLTWRLVREDLLIQSIRIYPNGHVKLGSDYLCNGLLGLDYNCTVFMLLQLAPHFSSYEMGREVVLLCLVK